MQRFQHSFFLSIMFLFMATVLFAADPALNAFLEENYEASLAYYLKRLENDPDNHTLHYNAGTAALKANRYDLASYHFNQSLKFSDEKEFLAKNWYNMGHLEINEGNLEEALRAFEQAILLNPHDMNSKVMYELVKEQLQQQQQEQQSQGDQNQQDHQENQQEKEQKESDSSSDKEESQEEKTPEKEDKQESSSQDESKAEMSARNEQTETEGKESTLQEKETELTRQQMINLLDAMREKEKEAMREILKFRYQNSKIEREKDW